MAQFVDNKVQKVLAFLIYVFDANSGITQEVHATNALNPPPPPPHHFYTFTPLIYPSYILVRPLVGMEHLWPTTPPVIITPY